RRFGLEDQRFVDGCSRTKGRHGGEGCHDRRGESDRLQQVSAFALQLLVNGFLHVVHLDFRLGHGPIVIAGKVRPWSQSAAAQTTQLRVFFASYSISSARRSRSKSSSSPADSSATPQLTVSRRGTLPFAAGRTISSFSTRHRSSSASVLAPAAPRLGSSTAN